MINFKSYWQAGLQSPIARRFVIATVLCSSLLALVITGIQLYIDYRSDVSSLNNNLVKFEKSLLPSLIESVWSIDEVLIRAQLEGMIQLDGIEHVAIIDQDNTIAFGSTEGIQNKILHIYPLEREGQGRLFNLGELQVTTSLDDVYQSLLEKALLVLLANTIKTLLVMSFIITIYQIMIGQHLTYIANASRKLKPDHKQKPLALNRLFSGKDELSDMENAINGWIASSQKYLDEQIKTQAMIATQRDELKFINEKLNQANEELTHFAYSASHDLKAPLTSINGFLNYAKKDINAGEIERALSLIDRANNESKRLADRIEDMLTLAKSELATNDWKPVDIEMMVSTIWENMQSAYPDVPSKITTSFEHSSPFICIEIRLQLILENLISNTLKYANPDKKICEVTIQTQMENNTLTLRISDNGIGIPQEHHHKVFKVFQRFARSTHSSSGLGLAIVKKNVDHLRGTIKFSSDENGTCFTLALPQDYNLRDHA